MKKEPRPSLFKQPPPPPGLFDTSDKRRLILMSVTLLILIVLFVVAQFQGAGKEAALHDAQQMATEPAAPELVEQVSVPEFDRERLRGLVSDSRETDRVLRESGGVAVLTDYVRGFGDPHFAGLGVQTLDGATHAALLADPEAHRAAPYRVRGTVVDFGVREDRDGRELIEGSLRLEDGSSAFFTVLRAPEALLPGDFIRFDGLFFKVFRDEPAPGEWVEGSYFVGNRAIPSHATLEPFDEGTLNRLVGLVEDDGTAGMTRLTGDAHPALWELMRFAQIPESDAVDWQAAPTLDGAMLARLIRDGEAHRGAPVQIPVSRIQDMRTASAAENPLRLEFVTTGWIGNTTWTGGSSVIQFIMPPQESDLRIGAYCTARGFFLKNLAYEDRSGTLRTAPYFVLDKLDLFVLPESTMIRNIAWFVAGLTLFLVALFFVLLTRDRKKSEQFQAELVRRRRARREREGSPEAPGTSPS